MRSKRLSDIKKIIKQINVLIKKSAFGVDKLSLLDASAYMEDVRDNIEYAEERRNYLKRKEK